jgi:hypothetical protein
MSGRRIGFVLVAAAASGGCSLPGASWTLSEDSGSVVPGDASPPDNDGASTDSGGSTPDDASGAPDAGVGAADGAGDGATISASCAKYLGPGMPASSWVYADATGNLQYKPLTASGDRIMDFSYAGYMGGGVAIPTVPVQKMVAPSGGDDSAAIQAAIDAVSKLPLQNGVRGAVLLAPGAFTLANPIAISASGVVLRGSGSGSGGTVITSTYGGGWLVRMHGSGAPAPGANPAVITDAYVPSGATSFHVDAPTKIAVGDDVLVRRPITGAWIAFMGMTSPAWLTAGNVISSERAVTAISGNAVTVDIPLSDSLDGKYVTPPGASVVTFTFPGRITQTGIEDIRFESPPRDATHQYSLVRVDAIADSWIRRVAVHNFTNGIWLGTGVKRVTVEDAAVTHDPTTFFTSEAPFDFTTYSEQTLVQRSSSTGGNKIWYYATQASVPGPNALVKFVGSGMNSHVTAHQRWSTGLLVDSSTVQGGILMVNNGSLGGGEGWSMGWGVVWNATSDVSVQAPPGAMNWSIGGTGAAPGSTSDGTYESLNTPVGPGSLYLAQLCARLGPAAVAAIGD